MIKSERILITGATGFVGACLTHYIVSQGVKPHITIREESNPWRIKNILDKVNLHYVDLRNADEVERLIAKIEPKIIYHCATYGGYPFQKDTNKIMETNIMGTVNLVNAALKVKFDCFVNTGSSSEYGLKQVAMVEKDLLEPVNDYGVAKASSTLFCQSIYRRFQSAIVTLRLFSPYGYYEEPTRLIPSVIISCLNRKNPKISSPNSVRDFIFIEDVVDAYIKVMENIDKIKGEIFNIGYGRQHSVGEVVNKIINLTGGKLKPEWGSISNPRMEPTCWMADISKVEKLLNWQPDYNLDEGLDKTIKWFKKNIGLYNVKNKH